MEGGRVIFSGRLARILKYWEILFFPAYSLVLCLVMIPDLVWGFDGHDANYLACSSRIWAGQIPFREFYPWYGPLYHYLFAWCVPLVSKDIYGVKFFLQIISPIASIGLIILALRNFGLAPLSRLFALAATVLVGAERIYYCGSLRSVLAVYAVSWLFRIHRRQKPFAYAFFFPAALMLFFFSPETGMFSAIASIAFLALVMLTRDVRTFKLKSVLWYAAGAALALPVMAAIYLQTSWMKNYLEYLSVINNNIFWTHGASFPPIIKEPWVIIFFGLPAIYLAGLFLAARDVLRNKSLGIFPLMVVTLTVLGGLLSYKLIIEFHGTRAQYALLPALIIASLAWAPPYRPRKSAKNLARALVAAFAIAGSWAFIPILSPLPYKGDDCKELMGVKASPRVASSYEVIKEQYLQLKGRERIAFPLKTVYYPFLGLTPDLPFDDPYHLYYPKYQQLTVDALEKGKFEYLIINLEDVSWDHTGEHLDPLMDYIDGHYLNIHSSESVNVLKRRPQPVSVSRLSFKDEQKIILDKSNNFTCSFALPDLPVDYLEFKIEFDFRPEWEQRLSMPIVQCKFDGQAWQFGRLEMGRQRVNPVKGVHSYRLYLIYPCRKIDFSITFPGLFNLPPRKILVTEFQGREFTTDSVTPRNLPYTLVPDNQP